MRLIISISLLAFSLVLASTGCEDFGRGSIGQSLVGCGNGTIDVVIGEECEPGQLNGATCADQGLRQGTLACDPATCRYDASDCWECGNGTLEAAEPCDGELFRDSSCDSQGFVLGGELGCSACALDTSECVRTEALLNHDGACTREVGCTNAEGTGGNPQTLLECFSNARIAPPFLLSQVDYVVGDQTTVPPDSLSFTVYSWDGVGAPGEMIYSQEVDPALLTAGAQSLSIEPPVEIPESAFCVGMLGADPNDGFRLRYSNSSTVTGASWIEAQVCNILGFVEVHSVLDNVDQGNLCIGATISMAADPATSPAP